MNYNSADHFYKVRMDGSHGNSNDTLYLYNHTAVTCPLYFQKNTHRDPGRRGGIVIARLYDDLDVDRWVLKQLHARKIFIAQRFTDYVGGFRISCQYFNNHADIDAMAAAMKELIQEIGRAPDYNPSL